MGGGDREHVVAVVGDATTADGMPLRYLIVDEEIYEPTIWGAQASWVCETVPELEAEIARLKKSVRDHLTLRPTANLVDAVWSDRPHPPAGKVRSLQNYDFESAEAQQAFDELVDKLRQELVNQQFGQMTEAMENMSPEDLARMKDMMAELNQMLEQRQFWI